MASPYLAVSPADGIRNGRQLGGLISNAPNQSDFPTQQRHLSYCVERPSLQEGGELNLHLHTFEYRKCLETQTKSL